MITKPRSIIPKPDDVNLKPHKLILKPSNVIPKPMYVILKPHNIIVKPHNAIPKPFNLTPKSYNLILKPHNVIGKLAKILKRHNSVSYRSLTARKTTFSFSKCSEKMVFSKKCAGI